MNLFKLLSTLTARTVTSSASQAQPAPRSLNPTEATAVAGGPIVQNGDS